MPDGKVQKRSSQGGRNEANREPAVENGNDSQRSQPGQRGQAYSERRRRSSSRVHPVEKDFVGIALKYCDDVLSGAIPACHWVRRACQRQLDDLNNADFPYRFDPKAATKVCKFVELCPHVKGRRFVGQKLSLEPWQCFILTTVFGWVSKATGLRRFRRAYIEVAKGNGKSALSSAVSNFMAFSDGEPGAEVYSAATTRDQARIVFSVSQAMLRGMPELCERSGIEVAAHSINHLRTNSFFRPLSSDANTVEGILPYFICIDELHAHPSRDLYDNLDTANGKRDNSLLWAITTAGSDRAGICYEIHGYVKRILDGTIDDDTFFAIIFTIDEEDAWERGPEVWRKPNLIGASRSLPKTSGRKFIGHSSWPVRSQASRRSISMCG